MKKILISTLSFIIISTIILVGNASTIALALENNTSHSDVPTSERYHIIENGYRDKYDLQEGIFGYQSAEQKNNNSVYFYSDGYFEDSPELYNASLSSMSLSLAFSCFNATRTDFDENLQSGSYSNLFRHVKVLMSDIGVEDQNIYINDGFSERPTEETIGVIMGFNIIVSRQVSAGNPNHWSIRPKITDFGFFRILLNVDTLMLSATPNITKASIRFTITISPEPKLIFSVSRLSKCSFI